MPHRAEILLLPILSVFPKENQGRLHGELESTHGLKPADRSFKCPFTQGWVSVQLAIVDYVDLKLC